MPEINLRWMVAGNMEGCRVFWSHHAIAGEPDTITASEMIAIRYTDFLPAHLQCERLMKEYPKVYWYLRLDVMEVQHA